MNKEDVIRRVLKVISTEACIPVDEMEINSAIMDDLDISSLELICMVCGFEEEFEIVISETEFSKVVTIEDIVDLIIKKL